MLYNRLISSDIVRQIIAEQESAIIFLRGKGLDERGDICEQIINPAHVISIIHRMDISESGSGKIKDTIEFKSNIYGELPLYTSLEEQHLRPLIEWIAEKSKYLILDITCLNIRFVGAFLAIASQYEWGGFICSYTEPEQYSNVDIREPLQSGYRLHNRIAGVEEIPNLETYSDRMGKCDWVAFLGYEGDRPQKVRDEPTECFITTPVISLPPMQPGWQNIAVNANLKFLESLGETRIEHVSAINPFATYNFLERYWTLKQNRRLIISPFGTRPISLGIILFLIMHRDCELLFDNPIQESPNTRSHGNSYFYDINPALNMNLGSINHVNRNFDFSCCE